MTNFLFGLVSGICLSVIAFVIAVFFLCEAIPEEYEDGYRGGKT